MLHRHMCILSLHLNNLIETDIFFKQEKKEKLKTYNYFKIILSLHVKTNQLN